MQRRALLAGLAAGATLGRPAIASTAGTWPERPIRMIVPFPAGGGTDIWARMVAEMMSPLLGQPMIIDNRAGAGGMVGAEAAARAAPDGYTLFYTIDAFIQAPIVQRRHPYDPVRDFAPIGRLGNTAISWTIGPAVPAEIATLEDYVAWARPRRDVSFGNWGAGATGHAYCVLFAQEAGIDAKQVSYRGEAPLFQDNLAGVVHGGFHSMAVTGETVRAGRLRPLATGGGVRVPSLADRVPLFIERGYSQRFNYRGFNGLFAPARTPQPILDRLAEVFRQVATSEEMRRRLVAIDTIPGYEDPAAFAQSIQGVIRRWTALVEELDLSSTAS
jgi:tripartite-type tricarboxylate transporter receptor subunit TctC